MHVDHGDARVGGELPRPDGQHAGVPQPHPGDGGAMPGPGGQPVQPGQDGGEQAE